MTERDSERLIADALKAKAGQTGGNRFASASSDDATNRLPTVTGGESQSVHNPYGVDGGGNVDARWILLLAAALGLATGAVVGLLTVL